MQNRNKFNMQKNCRNGGYSDILSGITVEFGWFKAAYKIHTG